jgi:hypothetical protein
MTGVVGQTLNIVQLNNRGRRRGVVLLVGVSWMDPAQTVNWDSLTRLQQDVWPMDTVHTRQTRVDMTDGPVKTVVPEMVHIFSSA